MAQRCGVVGVVGMLFVGASALGACGSPPDAKAPAGAQAATGDCPDLTKADEVSAFDFPTSFKLSRDAADKVRAAALASFEVMKVAEKLDAELGIACAQVAQGLGEKGDWRNGSDACTAAIKSVREGRAKLGPKARASLVAPRPLCLVDATLPTTCASICDSSVPAERAKADCEQMAGRCDAACDGVCAFKGAGACKGECSGGCDGGFKGTCGGRCKGTCDGKASSGVCTGVCVGACAGGAAVGECKGNCSGTCKTAAPSACEGTCAGSCAVAWSEPKCAGTFKAPDVSTDCRARCDLAVMNQTECGEPRVGYVVTGGKDRATEDAMKAAVEKAFPGLVKVLYEVGEKAPARLLTAQAVIDSARSGFPEMAASGGKATQATSQAHLEACFKEPFKKASATAASVKTLLDQAEAVRDEAVR